MSLDEKLDDIVRNIIHARDEGFPCIICGSGKMGKYDQVCHYFKRRHTATRWNLLNTNLGHESCNNLEEVSDKLRLSHMTNIVNKIGYPAYDELMKAKMSTLKMSKSDKQELKESLKVILKELVNEF